MSPSSGATNVAALSRNLDANIALTELLLPNGQVLHVQTAVLLRGLTPVAAVDSFVASEQDGTQMIPLIEETLQVGKRTVETGKVRLIKSVTAYEEQLNEPLALRTFDVERVVRNEPVDHVPEVRHEGSTTIYPVVEEQLVLTKRLVLKEEVRITQRDTQRVDTQTVTLRREHLLVEREDTRGGE